MNILYFISFLSIFIWIIVPLKQYGTRYFYFFLLLALKDITSLFLFYVLEMPIYKLAFTMDVLILFSLYNILYKVDKKYLTAASIFILPVAAVNIMYVSKDMNYYLQLISLIIILIYFLIQFFKKLYLFNMFSFFYFILVVYFSFNTLKFLGRVLLDIDGVLLFYFYTAFQALIGIYLLRYTHRDNNIKI